MKEEQNAVAPTPPSLSIARRQLSALHVSATNAVGLIDVDNLSFEFELFLELLLGEFFGFWIGFLLEFLLVDAVVLAGLIELRIGVGFA